MKSQTSGPIQTREQLILQTLVSQKIDKWKALESRAEALPAMLLRHGALPVKLFLQSKSENDKALWCLVEEGIRAVMPNVQVAVDDLTKLPFEQYMLVNEVAIEVATLLARWIKVQTSAEKSRAGA